MSPTPLCPDKSSRWADAPVRRQPVLEFSVPPEREEAQMVENGVQGRFFCGTQVSEAQVRLTGLRGPCTPGGHALPCLPAFFLALNSYIEKEKGEFLGT